jgi:hypothetical protein
MCSLFEGIRGPGKHRFELDNQIISNSCFGSTPRISCTKDVALLVDVSGMYGASHSPPAEHLLWGLLGRGITWDLWLNRRVYSAIFNTLGLGLPFNHAVVFHRAPVLFEHVATHYPGLLIPKLY